MTAYDDEGNSITLRTTTVQDDLNPVWNETLDFGPGNWIWFDVKVYDADWFLDDSLCMGETYYLHSCYLIRKQERMSCYPDPGIIDFEYSFYSPY